MQKPFCESSVSEREGRGSNLHKSPCMYWSVCCLTTLHWSHYMQHWQVTWVTSKKPSPTGHETERKRRASRFKSPPFKSMRVVAPEAPGRRNAHLHCCIRETRQVHFNALRWYTTFIYTQHIEMAERIQRNWKIKHLQQPLTCTLTLCEPVESVCKQFRGF